MTRSDVSSLDRLQATGTRVFSYAGARAVGIDPAMFKRLLTAGEVERLRQGWYARPDPARTAEERHWLCVLAELGARSQDPTIVASHYSALIGHRLPVVGVDLATVHVTRASGGQWRSRTGCVTHPAWPGFAVDKGKRVASVADALLGTGMTSGTRALVPAADAALGRQLVTQGALLDRLGGIRSPRIAELRWAVAHLDAASESPGESLLRLDMVEAGFQIVSQVGITANGRQYRADFQIKGTRVLVEFDGLSKYADPRVIVEEKRREQDLRDAGYEVVRFTWRDLGDHVLIRSRISKAIARAAGHSPMPVGKTG